MTFEEVWAKTSMIYGAFSEREAEKLYQKALAYGHKATFVEIGSYCGRSSSVLGMVARYNNCKLTCVDNFCENAPNIKSVKEAFQENMKLVRARYKLLAIDSQKATFLVKEPIDLLFIDGDHCYVGVKADCESWLPKLKKGCFVLFHDYNSSWEGVKKAVDEQKNLKLRELVDSMVVMEKV